MNRKPDEINMNAENAFLLREAAKAHADGYSDHLTYGGKGDPAEERWIEALSAGADALALIQQLEAENAEQVERIKQLEADKQQLEGVLTHMNQLRDAAAGRALKMEERVRQLEAERDALMHYLHSMGCDTCLYDDYDGSEPPCINCTATRDLWQFQGVQKEEAK